MADSIVEVSAAVIERPDGTFLMASRPEGKAYAGWWEFPGGKVEPGETAHEALVRELKEELGITATQAWPWLNRAFVYPHAHVMLRFFRVTDWQGTPHPHEGQELAWTHARQPEVSPILPANGPILKGLQLPLEYAISAISDLGVAAFLERLDHRLRQGLRFVQLREKSMPPEVLAHLAREASARCREHGALLAVNGDQALAESVGAALHLPAAQLMTLTSRPDLEWVGASCHDPAELDQAARLGLDWVVLGPVQPTDSHPGATPIGWQVFADWVRNAPMPVFALGGLGLDDLPRARAAGAHGVALRSGAWKL